VARIAGKIPALSDLPSSFSAMGAQRQTGGRPGRAGPTSASERPAELGGSVRGCDVREREKRGLAVGPTRRGKGTKIVAIAAGNSLPLAVTVDSASPAECRLVEQVLAGSFLDELPARLIGDKAYDSDPLDAKLAEQYDIELIAPNRCKRGKTQDGRKLRRYGRRWNVERLFAWMHHFRRLVTRWEYHVENFLGFVHLACLHMLLRHL
jgi:transposase